MGMKMGAVELKISANSTDELKAICRDFNGEVVVSGLSDDDCLQETRSRFAARGLVVQVVPFEMHEDYEPLKPEELSA